MQQAHIHEAGVRAEAEARGMEPNLGSEQAQQAQEKVGTAELLESTALLQLAINGNTILLSKANPDWNNSFGAVNGAGVQDQGLQPAFNQQLRYQS